MCSLSRILLIYPLFINITPVREIEYGTPNYDTMNFVEGVDNGVISSLHLFCGAECIDDLALDTGISVELRIASVSEVLFRLVC